MGAVCYKPKPLTLTKEDVLKALTQKHQKDSISPFLPSSAMDTSYVGGETTKAQSTSGLGDTHATSGQKRT